MVDRVGLRTYASAYAAGGGYAYQHACAAITTAHTPAHHNTPSNRHPHLRTHHHTLSNPHADTHHDDHGVFHRSQSLSGGNASF
jgi:hypothetical protein